MPNIDFVALDVETANSTQDSICQIGLAVFQAGLQTVTFQSLVNPQEDFETANTRIHGITPAMVAGQPTFPDLYPKLKFLLNNQLVVHFGSFDYYAIKKACMKYKLPAIQSDWLDLSKPARSVFAPTTLHEIAANLGIEYTQHNALEDALAAGKIFQHMQHHAGNPIVRWLSNHIQPFEITTTEAAAFVNTVTARYNAAVARPGQTGGPLTGQTIVFTGNLSISRPEAAELAAQAGANVEDSFTKRTTLLVVGDQDLTLLAGHEKSSKHRKAEEAIAKGQNLTILSESEFLNRVGK